MSSDDGIYILSTVCDRKNIEGNWSTIKCEPYKVYRVAYAQAIDNFYWYKEHEIYNLGSYMQLIWGKSKVHTDIKDAYLEATDIVKKNPYLEYGINNIETDMHFYGD